MCSASGGGSSRELHEVVCPAIEPIEDVGAEDHGHAALGALARQPLQQPAAPHHVEAAGGAREVRGVRGMREVRECRGCRKEEGEGR